MPSATGHAGERNAHKLLAGPGHKGGGAYAWQGPCIVEPHPGDADEGGGLQRDGKALISLKGK